VRAQEKTRRFSEMEGLPTKKVGQVKARRGKTPTRGVPETVPWTGLAAGDAETRIVDPEVKKAEALSRLRGRMARRRKCRHTAAKGATRYAVATVFQGQ